jgi:hypothetical protein
VLTFHDVVDAGAMVTAVGTRKAVEPYSESLGSALKGDYECPWFNT